MMKEKLKDSSDAYTAKWMKSKLDKRFENDLTFIEINGKPDVITFRREATDILYEFYKAERCEDINEEKMRVIETAANQYRGK